MNGELDEQRLSWVDMTLVVVFLLGIYLGVEIHVTSTIPLPAAPAGVAGALMLWRGRDQILPSHLAALAAVILLYLGSILTATDVAFLAKRFTGLVQLTYSLVIGYALFLTLIRAGRGQVAALLFGFCVAILVGCLLEDYGGLRGLSDAVRLRIYDYGIYDADLRDQLLYGRVRPKLFTSEPSAVTFAYTLYAFAWLIISRWRWKLLGYLALMGAGLLGMPGPTLLLMLALAVPYLLVLGGGSAGSGSGMARLLKIALLCAFLVGAFAVVGTSFYGTRLQEIAGGDDPSFFFRETGPALVARDVIKHHPVAGAGLTGEPFIESEVFNVFARSRAFSATWDISTKVRDMLTNYFWLHWIYLGLVWGLITLAGITIWLKVVGVPSALFCWLVWAIMGQASGAYVAPKTWTVLFLAAACSALHRRATRAASAPPAERIEVGPTLAALAIGRR